MPTFSNTPIIPEEIKTTPPPASEESKTTFSNTPDTEESTVTSEVTEKATETPADAAVPPITDEPVPVTPPPPTEPAFPMTPTDDVVVRNFGKAQGSAVAKLNADFELRLEEQEFLRLQHIFRDLLKRDPTAGELRLLDALDRAGKGQPHREAVGELYTDSPAIVEAWADMMAKHTALHSPHGIRRSEPDRPAPPCTFAEALTLIGRYLHRTGATLPVTDGGKNSDGRTVVLSALWQEADALTEGYIPVARMQVGDGFRSVWVRKGAPLTETPERSGDFFLYLRRITPSAITCLVQKERQKSRSTLGAIRAVANRSLLDTVLTLCESAELYPDRLTAVGKATFGGRVETDILCNRPTPAPDGTADYVLRIPLKRVREMTDILKEMKLEATVIGQVRSGDKTVIRMRNRMGTQDIPAVELPSSLIREFPAMGLHRRHAEASGNTSPVSTPAVTRLPAADLREDGMTPDSREIVALTVHGAPLMMISEVHLLMGTAAVTVTAEETGYKSAMKAISSAMEPLTDVGITPVDIRLSVTLTASDGENAPGDQTVEILCGLYRFAAKRGISIDDPVMTVCPAAENNTPSVTLTVAAWAKDKAVCESLPYADAQWHASGKPVHKESPCFLLPVLHRSCEGSLKALTAALNRDSGAGCVIRPVAIDRMEVEIPIEPAVETPVEPIAEPCTVSDIASEPVPVTRKEIRQMLNPDSVKGLCEQMFQWKTPIFAMSEADARMLLSEPAVVDALTRLTAYGYPFIVLGSACKPFAELGFLPAPLSHVEAIPTAGTPVTVTYRHPVDAVTRLPRTDLLAPVGDMGEVKSLLTLTLSDGTTVPDGFVGQDGKVLGLLNGVDTATVPLLRKHTFEC